MARAEHLKKLFQSFQAHDVDAFHSVASEIISDERKKHHPTLANELLEILRDGQRVQRSFSNVRPFPDPLPKDTERETPLVTVLHPERCLQDLLLDEAAQDAVAQVLAEWKGQEILAAHRLSPVERLLFCGPPGCGKTALAEALAHELGLPLMHVRFDGIVSSLLGETASNLRRVFDYASRGNWVILFDEFDTIGRSRADATELGEVKRVINCFLQLLDHFQGRSLIIAATNFQEVLDTAVWRRFQSVIFFDLPNKKSLEKFLCRQLITLEIEKSSWRKLVSTCSGDSFGDAERLCLDLKKACALAGSDELTATDLERALSRYRARRKALRQVAASDWSGSDGEAS